MEALLSLSLIFVVTLIKSIFLRPCVGIWFRLRCLLTLGSRIEYMLLLSDSLMLNQPFASLHTVVGLIRNLIRPLLRFLLFILFGILN